MGIKWLPIGSGGVAVTYQIVRQAILGRISLTATYDNYVRLFCPRTIGKDKVGTEIVEAFQYGGGSPGGLSFAGEWRCFRVSGLGAVSVNNDEWRTAADDPKHRDCVADIDVSSTRVIQAALRS